MDIDDSIRGGSEPDESMNFYVQYHNVDQEGLPLTNPPFHETRLGIHTRRPHVRDAQGRAFLVVGVGKPRQYYLWEPTSHRRSR